MVYILIFTICIYLLLFVNEEKRFNNEVSNNVQSVTMNMETVMSQADEVTNMVLSNDYVRSYCNAPETNNYIVTKIRNFLLGYINSLKNNNYDIYLLKENEKTVISNTSTMPVKYFSEMVGISDDDLYDIKNISLKDNAINGKFRIYTTYKDGVETDYFVMARYIKYIYSTPIYIFITIEMNSVIDKSNLRYITALEVEDKTSYIRAAGEDGEDISKLDDVLDNSTGGRYKVFASKLEYAGFLNNVNVIVAVKKLQYLKELNQHFFSVLLLAFILSLIGWVVTIVFSKKIYKPVDKLVLDLSDNIVIKDDEIEAISNRIHSLVKNNEYLVNFAEENKEIIRNKFFEDLLLNSINKNEIEQKINEYCLPTKNTLLITVILQYVDFENISQKVFPEVKSTVVDLLKAHFAKCGFFEVLEINPNGHTIIASIESIDKFKDDLKNVLENIETLMYISFYASVGKVVDSFDKIYLSYAESYSISKHQIFSTDYSTMICTMDNIRDIEESVLYYPLDVENALINDVINSERSKYTARIENIIEMNISDGYVTKEKKTQLVMMITSTISRIIMEINKNPSEIFGDETDTYRFINDSHTVDDLKNETIKMLDAISEYIGSTRKSIDYKTMKKMIAFVESNYDKDISLRDLSDDLNASYYHITRKFKELVGTNFKDYLLYYRYVKAKEIMAENPQIKVKDVAAMVGCTNSAALGRLFAKYSNDTTDEEQLKS